MINYNSIELGSGIVPYSKTAIKLDIVKKGSIDILADVRSLPFRDRVFEEVYASHLLEHFYKTEIKAVLQGILRIMKVDAKFYSYQPDLEFICKEFIENKQFSKESLLVPLYGDSLVDHQEMSHKWGYTRTSLTKLFKEVGFMGIEIRDGRSSFQGLEFLIIGERGEFNSER